MLFNLQNAYNFYMNVSVYTMIYLLTIRKYDNLRAVLFFIILVHSIGFKT